MDRIPEGQLCQAFDPMMILPEKTQEIIESPMRANTSCVAPAYVYLEGTRGKRFLCDYHYYYEKDMTLVRTPELWNDISKTLIDNREEVRKTFPKILGSSVSNTFKSCWCGKNGLVKATKYGNQEFFFCNFHYRKIFFRYLSNDRNMSEDYSIIDERENLKLSIAEEAERLTVI
jgi:hypothetical protein